MSIFANISFMPTKLRYKLLVCFCLMSLLPILAGAYIASLFIKFPFAVNPTNLTVISVVSLLSIFLSYLGYQVTRQMMTPILDVTATAQNIAAGKLDTETEEMKELADSRSKNTDELQELSRSLRTISRNAKELLEKVEKLSLKDKLTGLYNATYIRERLNEEIERAIHYQRPCSFAYFAIDRLEAYERKNGAVAAEEALKLVAKTFTDHMTEFARAARISQDEFVVIFPDKNKKSAIEIVERIGAELSGLFAAKGAEDPPAVFAGVSENPIDGVQADELYIKARDRMKMARAGKKTLEAFA